MHLEMMLIKAFPSMSPELSDIVPMTEEERWEKVPYRQENHLYGNPYEIHYAGKLISSALEPFQEDSLQTTPNPRPLFGKNPNEVFNVRRKRG